MVNELYAYFREVAPTLFFQSQSSSSHVSLRVILLLKMWKIVTKTFFGDRVIVERTSIHVWLHATAGELRNILKNKSLFSYLYTHAQRTTTECYALSDAENSL